MQFSSDYCLITCCNTDCGISYAVPVWWEHGKRQNHSWFYCPNGHRQHFLAESDEEKYRRERDVARQQVARAEQEAIEAWQRAVKAEKETKRLKKRTAAGTCPCCQRTFSNMAQHMKHMHPDFVQETGAKVIAMKVAK